MSKIIKSSKRFWLSGLWSLLIMILCFMPDNDSMDMSFLSHLHIDKIAHMVLYAVLAFLLKRDGLKLWVVFVLCFTYGFFIEICQGYFLPSRYFEIYDLIANIIGYFIGIGLYNLTKNNAYD